MTKAKLNYTLAKLNNKEILTFNKNSEGSLNLLLDEEKSLLEIIVEENAKWTINFEIISKTDIKLDINIQLNQNADLKQNLLILDNQNELAFTQIVKVNQGANYQGILLDISPSNVNFNNQIHLNGDQASSYFRSAVSAQKNEQKRIIINAINNAIYSTTLMDNYGVVKQAGNLLFEGIGKIEKDAKSASNRQNSKIIVFDEQSQANVKPLLLIDEYDVVASHSAAVGRINEDHMYYLCSRGLSKNQARQFITNGYLMPVLQYFNDENIKNKAAEYLQRSVK